MNALLSSLNTEQLTAVTLPSQHALILAGAGSGKTRVLTTRIAWLLQTGQATPNQILAVTFTNKAAKEMHLRISTASNMNIQSMWIGTFHGLCHKFLRIHAHEANLHASFQILDQQDQLAAIKRLVKTLQIDDEKYPPKQIQYYINSAKENGLRAKQVEAFDDIERKYLDVYHHYEDQCQREGVVDFAELLLRTFEILRDNQILREHYQQRFRHILVDEFQDTNHLQYEWLKLLVGPQSALFAVGDDDQSIYAFRGANVKHMQQILRDFKIQQTIRLEQNYRSHGNILDAANALIKHNPERMGKNLWTDAGEGEAIRIYEGLTDQEEARWIIECIKSYVQDEAVSRQDIAILYRSNAQSRLIEQQLFNHGIPYRVYGGLRFFERAEIKHALAYLRLIANPDDDNSFLRVVNFPPRRIGVRTVEQAQQFAHANHVSLFSGVSSMEGRTATTINPFIGLIDELTDSAHELPLPELIDHVIHRTGLLQHYQNEREGQDRCENLQELITAATAFIQLDHSPASDARELAAGSVVGSDKFQMLNQFLAHASLEAGDTQAQAGVDAVQLMTIHAAKGLEFKHVFITGLEEGLFPHENSLSANQGLEEERRLMYVAITRARERLHLSFAQHRMLHGQTRFSIASRFIRELPPQLLNWLSSKQVVEFDQRFTQANRSETSYRQMQPKLYNGFKMGMQVRHQKFGDGVIVHLEGDGDSMQARINFGTHGLKTLSLSVAKLEML